MTNPYESPAINENSTESGADKSRKMACPECGKPMENGYFPSTGIFWKLPGAMPISITSKEALPGTVPRSFRWGTNKVGGFRCRDCELVLFWYGSCKRQA